MYQSVIFPVLMGLTLGVTFLNLPPVLDHLMGLYGSSYGKISVLISALLWSHALIQVPGGFITDHIGAKRSLILSAAFMTVGNFLPLTSPDFNVALVGRIVTGFGTGQAFIATLKLVALVTPFRRIGEYQAYFAASFSIGSIVAYVAIPPLVHFGWQWAYGFAGIWCAAVLIAACLLGGVPSTPAPVSVKSALSVAASPVAWVIGVYHALSYGSMLNLGNWLPSVLAEVWNLSAVEKAGWSGALVLLISGLGRWGGGYALARIPPVAMANGSIGLLCVLYLALFLTPFPFTVPLLAVLAAWFASVNFGALFQIASRTAPANSVATFLGFVNFLANVGAILFNLAFGWGKEWFGTFSGGFLVMAGIGLIALVGGFRVVRGTAKQNGT